LLRIAYAFAHLEIWCSILSHVYAVQQCWYWLYFSLPCSYYVLD